MYEDIIDLPRHISVKHRHMSPEERAVQFAPFAALQGYHELIEETIRPTEQRRELTEERKHELGRQLSMLSGKNAQIRYFVPDACKEGGEYRTVTGIVSKIDNANRFVRMAVGMLIPFEDIIDIVEI